MHLNDISIFWENHDFPVICTQQCLLSHAIHHLYLYLFAGHKPIHIKKNMLICWSVPCELEMERQELPKGSNQLAHWHAKATSNHTAWDFIGDFMGNLIMEYNGT
jgi:hypothetical protein